MAFLSLADIGRRLDPDGKVADFAELLSQCNEMIDDLPMPKKVAVMLGTLCHDLGKPPTTKVIDGRIPEDSTYYSCSSSGGAAGLAPLLLALVLCFEGLDGLGARIDQRLAISQQLGAPRLGGP